MISDYSFFGWFEMDMVGGWVLRKWVNVRNRDFVIRSSGELISLVISGFR